MATSVVSAPVTGMGTDVAAAPAAPVPDVALADTPSVSPYQYLVACIIMLSFTAVFVIARVAANLRRERKLFSDAIALLSVLLLGALTGLSYYMNHTLFPDLTTPLSRMLLFTQITNWVAALAMWCSKAPVLFLFVTLFGVHAWLRWLCYGTLAVFGVAVVTAASVTTGVCDLRGRDPSPMFLLDCSDTASKVGVGLGVVSVVIDVIIIIIPMPVVLKLNLPTHKKIGLVVMFTSGIFAVVASAVSVYYKWESKNGSTTNVTAAMVCTMVENCITTIVGCIPATYTFWSQVVPASSLYLRLASAFSQNTFFSRKKSTGHSGGKSSEAKEATGGNSSTEHINHYNQYNQYVPQDGRYKQIYDENYANGIPLTPPGSQKVHHHV